MNTFDIKHQVSGVVSEMVLCGVNNVKLPIGLEYRVKNVTERLENEILKAQQKLDALNLLKDTYEEQKNLFYSKEFLQKLRSPEDVLGAANKAA